MQYYTYKITFKDLPGYFYYGRKKDNGKPYFGSPITWKRLWEQFEPEVQILHWYETSEEVNAAENSIIEATWRNKYSLNENNGRCVSEEVCRKNGLRTISALNSHPNTKGGSSKGGKKSGPVNGKKYGPECGKKNHKNMSDHPNTKAARVENGRKSGKINGPKNGKKASRPLVCVDTGEVYCSIKEASRVTGISSGSISNSCRKGHRGGGYHWEFT